MQDREPTYPGRVTLTPVYGLANTYDMERADRPLQEGTPLNKANLLKDATAALYGLGTGAVPNDVLAELGKYKQYWWARKKVSYVKKQTQSTSQVLVEGSWPVTITYADSISIDQLTGEISLINPQTVTLTNGGEENTLLGKYCKTSGGTSEKVLKFPESNVSWEFNTGYPRFIRGTPVYIVTVDETISNIVEYVRSSNRNAYPDSGTQDGYEYKYWGIPFDNAVTASKIATGSYTGTGTYGASNPNSLTFEFEPKFIWLYGQMYNQRWSHLNSNFAYCTVVATDTLTTEFVGNRGFYQVGEYNTMYAKKSADGKNVQWYVTKSAAGQYNASGYTYYYLAIG